MANYHVFNRKMMLDIVFFLPEYTDVRNNKPYGFLVKLQYFFKEVPLVPKIFCLK